MSQDQYERYRRLVEMHDAMNSPLVMINVRDLSTMLDCVEWCADHKPRVRRQAIKETTP